MKQQLDYRFHCLPKTGKWPVDWIYRQIVRMHRPGGIIVDTWKQCVVVEQMTRKHIKTEWTIPTECYDNDEYTDDAVEFKKIFPQADCVFDCYEQHRAFCVIDKKKQNKLLGWFLIMVGKFDSDEDYDLHATVQFFTKNSARGRGLGKAMFKKAVEQATLLGVNGKFFVYSDKTNTHFFRKMKKYVPDTMQFQNIYTEKKLF